MGPETICKRKKTMSVNIVFNRAKYIYKEAFPPKIVIYKDYEITNPETALGLAPSGRKIYAPEAFRDKENTHERFLLHV